jgi:hypothetical protein
LPHHIKERQLSKTPNNNKDLPGGYVPIRGKYIKQNVIQITPSQNLSSKASLEKNLASIESKPASTLDKKRESVQESIHNDLMEVNTN